MVKIKEKWKSVRAKLFFTLCVVIVLIILLLVLINSVVLEKIYTYMKYDMIKNVYSEVVEFYKQEEITLEEQKEFDKKLKSLALKNNLEILIKTNDNIVIIATNIEQLQELSKNNSIIDINDSVNNDEIFYKEENIIIKKVHDEKNNLTYMVLAARLHNNYQICIRTQTSMINESVRVSNNVLLVIGGLTILISGIIVSIIAKKFSKPILELNEIAEGMSNLDFSKKYRITDGGDEINNLGKSINKMSDKLEGTIKELKKYNSKLAKDIEEKSKIDEMRKQFISDVSHELKTPIALIQGYAEGLVENVNVDMESQKYYAEVILDESNKMDKLVRRLLELMKLEYDVLALNNKEFDIVELINDVIKKYSLMINDNEISLDFDYIDKIKVIADDFYIEQVISNYITNAIKYSKIKNGERKIKIKVYEKNNKIRVSVFNTGDNIDEDDLNKIWGRFYKVDASRNRETGGTGIGLAYVKAVMNNYKNDYGVINRIDGVEFYFECIKS